MVLSKDQAKSELVACLKGVRAVWVSPEGKSLGEAMTRHHFINEYIRCLGYEGIADLELEHQVKNTGKFIDYVLKVGGQPIVAIEAKALGAALSDDVGAQLLEYQVVENIEWGVATNARDLWVYYLYLQGPPREKRVLKIDLLCDDAEFDRTFDRLWLLSKESMSTGTGLRSLIKESQLEKAIERAILDRTSKVVSALKADVKECTQGKISVTPDEVVSWLRNRLARGLSPALSAKTPLEPTPAPVGERKFVSFLKQMIDCGIIPADAEVSAVHAGQEYKAVVDSAGYLIFRGERIRKPGFAAKRITGTATDGFAFWRYQGVSLAELRAKLWQQ